MDELLVRRAYTHNKITVVVEIDFVAEKISLVERDGDPKKWTFTDRGLEYMNGWKAIFQAMEWATTQAAEVLNDELNRRKEKDFKQMLEILAHPKLIKSAYKPLAKEGKSDG